MKSVGKYLLFILAELTIVVVAFVLFSIFIDNKLQEESKKYSNLFAHLIWGYDNESAERFLDGLIQTHGYTCIQTFHNNNEPFVERGCHNISNNFNISWHQSPIIHQDKSIGIFKIGTIYSYFWFYLISLLIATVLFMSFYIFKEKQHTSQERKKYQQQLMLAEKAASLGTMGAGIAHELNNPLTVVMGFNDVIKKAYQKNTLNETLLQKCNKEIHDSCIRMKDIIQHIRTFSRNASLDKKDECNIINILQDILRLSSVQMNNHGIKVTMPQEFDCPLFFGNRVMIESVLRNLINNSKDAFEEQLNSNKSKEIKIEVESDNLNSFLIIKVSDNGPGIKPNHLEQIFDPFFTTKSVGKGMGLGLSLCYSIIKDHDGDIEVKSQQNIGTTFIIKLPLIKKGNDHA